MDHEQQASRETLLRRSVLSGDEAAWEMLYAESFEPLWAYVAWRCGGIAELTDEIVQQTWLVAVRRIRRFDPNRGTFIAWLRGIAGNALRNHFRKQKRERSRQEPLELDGLVAETIDPAIARDRAERVARSLAELPEPYEQVLMAKYFDHRSVAEIARDLNATPKAIESRLSRARAAFREVLGGRDGADRKRVMQD